ncbi:uncharacterized protein LOC110187594 [Drosophila serrata]|uniref:uncharacterized protein LOC110187594 n=1 Tax=Drosophila serrata TaxID=7274 RepID=UPI000A1D3663|nr:uncharacterized protein LOC110187594 [Drosophila serrata]
MGRPVSQRRQSMRFVSGQGPKSEPEPQSQPDNEPEAEPPCQELDPVNTYQEEPLPMRKWMRWQNCKTFELTNTAETYPSIRPPINTCTPGKSLTYIDDSMEVNQCGRMFQMGKDDVLAVWNQSPRKDTLAWYGIGEQSASYNDAVAKSLQAASQKAKKPKKSRIRPEQKLKVKEPLGPYVLDRVCLKAKLDKMPNVRRQLKANNALSWLHCPEPVDPDHPFEDQSAFPKTSIQLAPAKRSKSPRPPKRGLRRKHWYCPHKAAGGEDEENKCITYERAMKATLPAVQGETVAQEPDKEPEPRNYDELYKSLECCFVQNPNGFNDICETYEQCCKDPEDQTIQGCNEFLPETAGESESCCCLEKCNCVRSKGGRSPKVEEQQQEQEQEQEQKQAQEEATKDDGSMKPIDIE